MNYPYSYMAFLISENAETGMYICNHGEIELIKWYNSIEPIGMDFLLAKNKNKSFILDKMGNMVSFLGQYRFKRLINEDTYLAEICDDCLIKKFDGKVVAPIVLGNFERLTDENHYLSKDNNGYSIYDFYGNVISGGYDAIKNFSKKYIVAAKGEESYLLDLSGMIKLKSKDFMTVVRAFWKTDKTT